MAGICQNRIMMPDAENRFSLTGVALTAGQRTEGKSYPRDCAHRATPGATRPAVQWEAERR